MLEQLVDRRVMPGQFRFGEQAVDLAVTNRMGTSKNPRGRAGLTGESEVSGWLRSWFAVPFGSLHPERQGFVALPSGRQLPSIIASRPDVQGLARGSRWFLEVPVWRMATGPCLPPFSLGVRWWRLSSSGGISRPQRGQVLSSDTKTKVFRQAGFLKVQLAGVIAFGVKFRCRAGARVRNWPSEWRDFPG